MTGKKKILIVLAALSLIIAIPITLLAIQLYSAFAPLISNAPDHVVEDYVEEKYGFKVDVIEANSYGIGSATEYTVSPKDEEHIQFTVSVDPYDYTLIEDDYGIALEIDKEYEKLKTVIPEIEALGFSGLEGAPIRLHYLEDIEDKAFLHLESDKSVNYATFVEEDFDTYYELYGLIKKSQANIENVAAFNDHDQSSEQNGISFYMGPPEETRTKEELLLDIKVAHPEIVEHEVEERLAEEVELLNNERFYLGNQYDESASNPVGSWFNCPLANSEGKCELGVLSVTYEKDGLNKSNPKLVDDVASIIQFVETHLEPKIRIDYIYFDESDLSNEELAIGYEDRMTYRNTDELLDFLFSEQ